MSHTNVSATDGITCMWPVLLCTSQDEDMMAVDEQGASMPSLDTPTAREVGPECVAGPSGRHDQQTRGAVEGECAFCGNGNETEPLGWVVSLPVPSLHVACMSGCQVLLMVLPCW